VHASWLNVAEIEMASSSARAWRAPPTKPLLPPKWRHGIDEAKPLNAASSGRFTHWNAD
jgi:hypothetical protein